MYKTLSPGVIGIRGKSLNEQLSLAEQTGFEGLDFSIQEAAKIAADKGAGAVEALFKEKGIKYGAWDCPSIGAATAGARMWRRCPSTPNWRRSWAQSLLHLVPANVDRARV